MRHCLVTYSQMYKIHKCYRFTVYPVMPTTNIQDSQSDRAVLSRPSLVLVTWLLDSSLDGVTKTIGSRLAAALAACAQLSSLGKSILLSRIQEANKFP